MDRYTEIQMAPSEIISRGVVSDFNVQISELIFREACFTISFLEVTLNFKHCKVHKMTAQERIREWQSNLYLNYVDIFCLYEACEELQGTWLDSFVYTDE